MRKPFILVVDDNKITTKLLRRYIEAANMEAREAYDGIDCLDKVNEKLPDAIIPDVMMPRMDGYETVKRLKSNDITKEVPVVIVTALNDVPNQLKSIECGAEDFLSKPIEEKLLIAKVKILTSLFLEKKRSQKLTGILYDVMNGNLQGKSFEEIIAEADLD